MPSLQEVVDHSREGESSDRVHEKGDPTYLGDAQRSGSRAHMKSDGLVDSDKDPGLGEPEGGREEGGNRERNTRQQTDGKSKTADTNLQDQFYRRYREVADEYDKEFLKKYNEDLNTTLIFAGLFSAVASAFIIEVNSELKPDPNDETAALLRVLLYKIDNTTFGKDVPSLPQWSGPAEEIVQVQAILFSSLAASLLSALLAVLGKQWLSRYDLADVKGTAIERAQNRQRKLDGINAWYFHSVMEALPVMLQFALLLLGCALSRYLWQVHIVVASVVLGVTSLGMTFYLAIVIAGTVDESCPYQTPAVNFLRQVLCLFGGLGDIEILKSYFLLVWSEWHLLYRDGLREMEISIREDFGGVERWRDREELIERLDRVLRQLSLEWAHFKPYLQLRTFDSRDHIELAASQYNSLRDTLLDVHANVLLRSRSTFSCALPLPCP